MPVLSGSSNAPLDKIYLHTYIYKDVWATNYINNMKKKMSVIIKSKAVKSWVAKGVIILNGVIRY